MRFIAKPQRLVTIGQICLDESPRMRHSIRDEVVAEYAEIYRTHKQQTVLPPVELFKVKGRPFYYIADGLHRICAAKLAGLATIKSHVNMGSWADCLRAACSYNVTHGLRRSDEDKRMVVEEIFMHGGAKFANNYIAALAHVSEDLVSRTRKLLEGVGSIQAVEFRKNAAGVERKVREKAPNKNEEHDRQGTVVPPEAMPFWERRNEVNPILDMLEAIRAKLYTYSITNDVLFGEVDFHAAAADLRRLTHNLKMAQPYAVCTQCQGRVHSQPNEQCSMCKGKGLISQFRFQNCSPEEIKLIRDRANKAETIPGNGD